MKVPRIVALRWKLLHPTPSELMMMASSQESMRERYSFTDVQSATLLPVPQGARTEGVSRINIKWKIHLMHVLVRGLHR